MLEEEEEEEEGVWVWWGRVIFTLRNNSTRTRRRGRSVARGSNTSDCTSPIIPLLAAR
jgi:hypothetical protein